MPDPMRRVLPAALPAILVALVTLVPNLDRAFTIDDTFFLSGAVHAVEDPLHPSAYEIVWQDAPERVGATGGFLMAWLLVPAVTSARPEVVAHLLELALFILAIICTVSFAMRLGATTLESVAAGFLLASTPTAVAMAGTAMADVPAMALGILGLERLMSWRTEGRWHQAVVASMALALAPMARPQSLLLLAVGFLLMVPDPIRPRTWIEIGRRGWAPLLGALGILATVLFVTWDRRAGAPGLHRVLHRLSETSFVGPNAVAFLVHWALAFPLAVPWLLLRGGAVGHRAWLVVPGALGSYAILALVGKASLLGALAAGLGLTALVDILYDAWSRKDGTQIVLGLWLLVPLVALPYSHLPAKLGLVAGPAVAVLVARQFGRTVGWRSGLVLAGSSVAGLALGLAILSADGAFAGLGRRAVVELVEPHMRAGGRVWFTPHWGFQWYAQRAGAVPATVTPPYPAPGDLIVNSRNTAKGQLVSRMIVEGYNLSLLARIEDSRPGGRVMTEGAGFFSNTYGVLPWTWGEHPVDSYTLWRVNSYRGTGGKAP